MKLASSLQNGWKPFPVWSLREAGCYPKKNHTEHGARRKNRRKRTFSSTRLDDEDILATDALFDLYTRLTALELVKEHLRRRYAEMVADGPARWSADGRIISPRCRDILSELRVRAATQDDDVANHDESGGRLSIKPLAGTKVKGCSGSCARKTQSESFGA